MNCVLIRNSLRIKCKNKQLERLFILRNSELNGNNLKFSISYSSITSNKNTITSQISNSSYNCKEYTKTKRFQSTESGPPAKKWTSLSDFPEIIWPSFFKSIRNFFLTTLIIRPYFDREFTLTDFVKGSKQAVEVVSAKLSEGDFKSLEGLVTKDLLPSLQKSISSMSLAQREELNIRDGDIYFSFPYQVGIIFSDDKSNRRFVEITMVYHALRGLSLMRARGEEPPVNMGLLPEYRTRISICNYRFIREFTKGVDDEWTINLLNHFKPAELIENK